MGDSTGDPETTSTSGSQRIGGTLVGKTGIIAIAAYLVVFSILLLYVLIKIWPRSTPSGSLPVVSQTTSSTPGSAEAAPGADPAGASNNEASKTASNSANPAGTQINTATAEPVQISLFWGLWSPWLWNETRLLFIVIFAGAFGSLVHAIRSFYWYVGSRDLRWSWTLTYLLLPFNGGILAMLFYFVVRGGFFSSQSTIKDASPFACAAFSGLTSPHSGGKRPCSFVRFARKSRNHA